LPLFADLVHSIFTVHKKRIIKRLALGTLFVLVSYAIYYCWISFPVATGYGAKVYCSAYFLSQRSEETILQEDLDFLPLNYASYTVDLNDSSVTCSLFGTATRKAIFRKAFGATLVREIPEEKIRAQSFQRPQPPATNRDTIPWPMGDKLQEADYTTIDSVTIANAVNRLFIEQDSLHPIRTRALIVLHRGQIVAEKYAPGIGPTTPLAGWSMTKSITGALAGILVQQGRLQIDAPAPVPEWNSTTDPRRAITLRNLLQQSSGLQFEEDYAKNSNATRMLFMRADMGGYAASLPLIHAPGSVFSYSSGNSNILSRILRQTIGERLYHSFPYEQLFFKLGMFSTTLEPDASGTYVGSSYCYATARDWARFGLLYANNGMANGASLLSSAWIRASLKPAPAAAQGQYGFQWWLNSGAPADNPNRRFPALPADMFWADGYEGQNIYILPSQSLVVVRLGTTRAPFWGEDNFLQELIKATKE